MKKNLDMRGYSFPLPLLRTQDALASCDDLTVLIDEPAARENILKFAASQNYKAECIDGNGEWRCTSLKNIKGVFILTEEIRIITFPSVWHAFRAEKILKAADVPCALIPVPRELSSSCQGLAAKLTASVLDKALELLDAQRVLTEKRGVKVTKI